MANSAVVGILRTILTTDTAEYEAGFRRAKKEVTNFGKESTKAITQFQAALGPLGGAIAGAFSIGAITSFVSSVFDAVDVLDKLHDQTGISFRGLQILQAATDVSGDSFESVTSAINAFQRRLGDPTPTDEFKRAMDRVGLSTKEFLNLSPEERFIALGKALETIPDQAEKVYLATVLMGKGGAEALATLKQDFDKIKEEFTGLTDHQAKEIARIGDNWQKFKRAQTVGGGAAGLSILEFLSPFEADARAAAEVTQQLADQQSKLTQQIRDLTPELKALGLSEKEITAIEKSLNSEVQVSIDKNQARIKAARDLHDAQEALRDDFNKTADAIEKVVDKIDDAEGLQAFRDDVRTTTEAFERWGDEVNSLNENLDTLDSERKRALLGVNPPGVAKAGSQLGARLGMGIGDEMKDKLKDAFADIPHFLTSSVLHSGSFINGLKALGVSMADAIAEPLIRELGRRIAGMAIGNRVATVATGAGAGAGLIGLIPGIGGIGSSPAPPNPINAPQPVTPPPGGGIIPLPPSPPGGGGPGVPTRPPISNLSIPMGNQTTNIFVEGVLDSGNFVKLMRGYGVNVVGDAMLNNEQFITTRTRKGLGR